MKRGRKRTAWCTKAILHILSKSKVAHLNAGILEQLQQGPKKKNKYRNTKTTIDGITFDSAREAKRYKILKLLLKKGKIGQLELQPEYELNEGGKFSYKYQADFRYLDAETGQLVVEDAKGHRTKEYKKKRRLMLKLHGIKILET